MCVSCGRSVEACRTARARARRRSACAHDRRGRSARRRGRRSRSRSPSPWSDTSTSDPLAAWRGAAAPPRPRRGAARCRPGCRAPGRSRSGSAYTSCPSSTSTWMSRPRSRGAVGEALRAPRRAARAASSCSGRTGSSPSPARATISRSSASWARWSHSSSGGHERLAHLRVLARRRAACPPAPPSTTASGVRSSWLASATKRRSRSNEPRRRSSISLSVSPSRRISSWAAGSGSRSSRLPSDTSLRAPAHRLDRSEARAGQQVADPGRQQHGDRAADQERVHETGERLVAILSDANDDDGGHPRSSAGGRAPAPFPRSPEVTLDHLRCASRAPPRGSAPARAPLVLTRRPTR